MTNLPPQSLQRQRGNMLVGAIIALLIGAIALIGVTRQNIEKANSNAGAAQGQAIYEINKALGVYMTHSSRVEALRTGGSISGVANIMAPTIAELQGLGLLSATTNPTPANGGSYVTQIVLLPAGCVNTECNIASRLWLTQPVLDSFTRRPDIKRIGALLAAVGGNGGFSDTASPAVIHGSGGWSLPNPDPTQRSGMVMAVNGYGSTIDSNYVRIRDTRDPDLQGDLTLQGYLSVGGSASLGAACTTPGRIGKTSGGVLLICQAGQWQNVSGIDQIVTAGAACTAGQVGRDSNGVLMSCQSGQFKDAAGFPNDVVAGTACTSAGLFGLDAVGKSYLCRNGTWVSQSNLTPTSVEVNRYVVTDASALIAKPSCATGGSAAYDMTPMSVSLDLTTAPPYSALEYMADDYTSTWLPRITLKSPSGSTQSGNVLGISALFRVYCIYPA